MSSVDERVVEMRFDNAQFERGVNKTLLSLDRLKEGLKFNGAISGLNVIQNAINGVKLGGIEKGVDKINNRFSALGIAGIEVVKRITNSAISAASRIATAIPRQIKQGGWERALNIENARFQLDGLKVAWEDVNKDLQYAVNGTAYGLDSAAKAASQLSASGIKASSDIHLTADNVDDLAQSLLGVSSATARSNGDLDDMSIALRSIAGVAAMTNSSYDDIANIYTRIAGQGRVMAQDLNSLAARGLNVAATLAQSMGITEEKLRELVGDGKISFQQFSDAMYDAYADHAIEANKIFEGALANTKSALSKIGAEVEDDVLPALTRILNAVRNLINSVKAGIMPILTSLGKLALAIGETVGRIIDKIRDKLDIATDYGKRALTPVLKISGAIDKLTSRVTALGQQFERSKDAGKELANTASHETSTLSDIMDGFANIGKTVAYVISQIGRAIGREVVPAIKSVDWEAGARRFKNATGALMKDAFALSEIRRVISGIVKGISNIIKAAVRVFGIFNEALKETFYGIKGLNASTLSDQFLKMTEAMKLSEDAAFGLKKIFKILLSPLKMIVPVVQVLIQGFFALGQKVGEANNAILGMVGRSSGSFKLITVLQKMSDKVSEFAHSLSDVIKGKTSFNSFIGGINANFAKLWETLKAGFSSKEGFKDMMSSFAAKFKKGFENLASKLDFGDGGEKIKKRIEEFFTNLFSAVDFGKGQSTAEPMLKGFITFLNGFCIALGAVLSTIGKLLGLVGKGLVELINQAVSVTSKLDIAGFTKNLQKFLNLYELYKTLNGIANVFAGAGKITKNGAKVVGEVSKLVKSVRGLVDNIGAVAKSMKKKLNSEAFKTFANAVLQMSLSLFIIASIKTDKLLPALGAMAGMVAMMVATIKYMTTSMNEIKGIDDGGKSFSKKIGAVSKMFLAFGVTILLISSSVKKVAKLDPVKARESAALLGIFFAEVVAAIGLLARQDKVFKGAISSAIFIGIVLGTITKSLAILSFFSFPRLAGAFGALSMMLYAVVGAVFLLAKTKMSFVSALSSAILIGTILNAITLGLGVLSLFPFARLAGAFGALSMMLYAVVGAVFLLAKTKMSFVSALSSAILIGTILNALTVSLAVLSLFPFHKLMGGFGALSMALYAVVGAIAILALVKTEFGSAMSGALSIAIILTSISSSLMIIALFPFSKLMGAVLALSTALYAVVGAIAILALVKTEFGSAMSGALSIALIISSLSTSLGMLSLCDFGSLMGGVAVLLIALYGTVKILELLQDITTSFKNALAGAIFLSAVITSVSFSLALLAAYSFDQLGAAATALVGVILAVTVALKLLNDVSINFGTAIGGAILISMVMLSMTIAISFLAAWPFDSLIGAAGSLSMLILALSKSLDILSRSTVTFGEAMKAAVEMAAILGAVGIVFGLILKFMPNADKALSTAIALSTIIGVLGGFVAAIAKTQLVIADPVTFLETVALIAAAIDILMVIVSAGLMASIEILQIAAPALVKIGKALGKFIKAITENDAKTAGDACKNIGIGIAALAASMCADSVQKFFGGGIEKKLPKFGTAFKEFVDKVGTIPKGFGKNIKDLASGIKSMSKLKPKKLEKAADGMETMRKAIASYIKMSPEMINATGASLTNFTQTLQTVAANAASGSQAIATNTTSPLASMPTDISGSLEGAMTSLMTKMPELQDLSTGQLMGLFESSNGTIQNGIASINTNGSQAIDSTALNMIQKIAAKSPDFKNQISKIGDGSLVQLLLDCDDYTKGGTANMNALMDAFESADPESAIETLVGKATGSLANKDPEYAAMGAEHAVSYAAGISGSGDAAGTAASELSDAAYFRVFGKSKEDMKSAGKNAASGYSSGLTDANSKASAKNGGSALKDYAVNGANNNASTEMGNVGKNMSLGFANGVDDYGWLANSHAKKMVSDAIEAAKKEAKEHSPSKRTYEIGKFFVLGMSNAIRDTGHLVSDETVGTMQSALDNMSALAAEAAYEIEHGLDGVTPTISPVVDLTNVRRSAYQMGSLFSTANVNAGAIQYDLNKNYQNGSIPNGVTTTNNNAVTNNITVNAAPGQSVEEIADAVSNQLNFEYQKKRSVFA